MSIGTAIPSEQLAQPRRGGRPARPNSALSPLQLRQRCHAILTRAIRDGEIPRLAGSGIKCTDCDDPASCYDHRNYFHPLAVDPVCKGCNNRRGPGFPINPDGDHYTNDASRQLGGNVGARWSNLEGGRVSHPTNNPEKSVRDFIDEHWITWETDNDLRKYRQWCSLARKNSVWFSKSFSRGLFDWFGIEPV